jgi:DNA-binding response OmpR family regulator
MKLVNCVWLVSSDPKTAELLTESFAPGRYDAISVPSLADESVRNHPAPDLVLFDADSSGGRFLEVEALKGLHPSAIVIAMSQDESDRESAADSGCADFIPKPVSKDEILLKADMALQLLNNRFLLEEKARLDCILEAIGDGIVVLTKGFQISRLNSKAAEFLNLRIDARAAFFAELRKAFKVKHEGIIEIEVLERPLSFEAEKGGQNYLVRTQPLRDPFRGVTGAVVVFTPKA